MKKQHTRAGDLGRCTIQACTGGVRKDKAQMKWNMARKVKGNGNKDLTERSSATRRLGKNKAPQLSGAEDLLAGDTEKAKVLAATFASVVTSKNSPQSYPGLNAVNGCVSNHCYYSHHRNYQAVQAVLLY